MKEKIFNHFKLHVNLNFFPAGYAKLLNCMSEVDFLSQVKKKLYPSWRGHLTFYVYDVPLKKLDSSAVDLFGVSHQQKKKVSCYLSIPKYNLHANILNSESVYWHMIGYRSCVDL
jgi:hypothetical protein